MLTLLQVFSMAEARLRARWVSSIEEALTQVCGDERSTFAVARSVVQDFTPGVNLSTWEVEHPAHAERVALLARVVRRERTL